MEPTHGETGYSKGDLDGIAIDEANRNAHGASLRVRGPVTWKLIPRSHGTAGAKLEVRWVASDGVVYFTTIGL